MNTVNPQVLNAVEMTNQSVTGPSVPQRQGAGNAYQAVAQSMAISVQDASMLLRNLSTIATTAIGVATAKLVGGDATMIPVIEASQKVITDAAEAFKTIGVNSGEILQNFPSGD